MSYTFGDSDIAARRLEHLAQVYEPSSTALLQRCAPRKPRLAVDLGCGPGHTTHLLHDTCAPATTVGVDSSARYVDTATGHAGALPRGVTFVCADVADALPDAAAGADVVYVRFLLTHLAAPERALAAWRRRVAPEAVLVVEELEWMRSEHPALTRYYGIVETVQEAHGQRMYVGPEVEGLVRDAGWSVVYSEVAPLEPAGASMALLHTLNLTALRDDPALASTSPGELDHLARSLESVARGQEEAHVDYGMRQVVATVG